MARAHIPAHSGVLVIDKAAGCTSFDVVARARCGLGERRIGHAGTLDPAATGVLPLLVGEATKMMPYLVEQEKEYVAVIRLGVTTDTCDLTGRIVATSPVPPLDRSQLERALQPFVGRIRQAPPMYSAVHHEGRRLYELAREGRDVPRAAREVIVHSIALTEFDGERLGVRVVCGKGTYVRVIAADLGAALGCGGTLEHLIRDRVGPFSRGQAMPSGDLERLDRTSLLHRLLPVEAALADWPSVDLGPREAVAFAHGQVVPARTGLGEGALVRMRDREGRFLGVGMAMARGTQVRPARVVHADRQGTRVLPA
jgi:tRNA pseudouridine55 synthase